MSEANFRESDHTYHYRGRRIPSVTELLKPVTGYRGDGAAMALGTAVHDATALDDYDDLDEDSVQPEVWPYLEAWRSFRRQHLVGPVFDGIEEMVHHPRLGYAGTLDRRGEVQWPRDGHKPSILDIKTGSGSYPWYPLQLYAYAIAAGGDAYIDRAKRIEALRVSVTRPLDQAKAAAQALFKPPLDELARLEREVKQAILTYQRIRDEQIEVARIEQAARIVEAERRARDEADLANLAGEDEAEVDMTPVFVAAVSVPVPQSASVEGLSSRTNYHAEVTDFGAFVAHCSSTGVLHYLDPNMKLLNQLAVGLKREGVLFPGVTSVATKTLAVR